MCYVEINIVFFYLLQFVLDLNNGANAKQISSLLQTLTEKEADFQKRFKAINTKESLKLLKEKLVLLKNLRFLYVRNCEETSA